MNNLKKLTDDLMAMAELVKTDPSKIKQAREMSNIAGRVISANRVYLEYKRMTHEEPVSAGIDSMGDKA